MKTTYLSLIGRISVAAIALTGFQAAQAALVGPFTGLPDLTTNSAALDYTFTEMCTSGDGGSGVQICGTTEGKGGNAKSRDVFSEGDSSGLLTITGSNMVLLNEEGVFDIVAGGSYSLTANFSGAGLFTDGTVTATGIALSGDPDFSSGTIVTADLDAFGYSGIDAGGTIDFSCINVGGDFAAFISTPTGCGVTATTFDMAPASGNWDTGGLDFQANFAAEVNVDTVVPIPAAAWLFGSGLMALAGLHGRSRKNV